MKLSIVTPVYNRKDCIIRCLESVSTQNKEIEIEHWIVDDGSIDNTFALIEEYGINHSHLKIHRFPQNRGVNAARNFAIAQSTGEFILFLDSDDILTNSAISIIKDTISEHPNYMHYLFAVDAREAYYKTKDMLKGDSCILEYKNWIQGDADGDFAHVINRNMLVKYPFDEKIRIYEDTVLFKLYKHSKQQYFSHKIIMEKERGREDSVTKEYFLFHRNNIHAKSLALHEMITSFYNDFIEYGEAKCMKKMILKYLYLVIADENYMKYDEMVRNKHITKGLHFILRKMRMGKITRYGIILLSNLKNRNKKLE